MIVVTIALGIPAVSATSSYLAGFNQHYDTSDTRLDSCATCHSGPNGGSLNPYGRAYAGSGGSFASIENQDSDGDSFVNLEEIDALSFPGNTSDYPQTTSEMPAETDVNVTEQVVDQNAGNQTTDIQNTEEAPVNGTTEQQTPGFGAIIAIIGMLSVIYIRRKR